MNMSGYSDFVNGDREENISPHSEQVSKVNIKQTINNYSSASSRAENEYEKGISAGIEMFRKYLIKELR